MLALMDRPSAAMKRPAAAGPPSGSGKRRAENPVSPTWAHGKLSSSATHRDILSKVLGSIPTLAARQLKVVSSFRGISPIPSFAGTGPAIKEVLAAVPPQRVGIALLQRVMAAEHIIVGSDFSDLASSRCVKHGGEACAPDLGDIDLVVSGGDEKPPERLRVA